jgi:hypothetical protein
MWGLLNQKKTSSCHPKSAGFPPGKEVSSKKMLSEILFDINSKFASMGELIFIVSGDRKTGSAIPLS